MSKRILHPNHKALPKNFYRLPDGYGIVKIGVSGSADLTYNGLDAFEKAKEVGREIAKHGAILTTGATTGFPLYAAMGVKDECGFSIGFSPASTEREHIETYKLPRDYMDVVVYTGFGYSGRDILFVRSSDAMIVGPGRIGTINEFAVAFEDHRPIGVLEGSWQTDKIIKLILENAHRPNPNIIFESDPKALVEHLIEMALDHKMRLNLVYDNHEGWNPADKGLKVIL
ncbi:MAG TPA: protein containing YHS domain protein [Candidatus Paceibacterota bacterium]|nr:protein containing YHS domain protein [Candidatus Paceibacterota bacterium]